MIGCHLAIRVWGNKIKKTNGAWPLIFPQLLQCAVLVRMFFIVILFRMLLVFAGPMRKNLKMKHKRLSSCPSIYRFMCLSMSVPVSVACLVSIIFGVSQSKVLGRAWRWRVLSGRQWRHYRVALLWTERHAVWRCCSSMAWCVLDPLCVWICVCLRVSMLAWMGCCLHGCLTDCLVSQTNPVTICVSCTVFSE